MMIDELVQLKKINLYDYKIYRLFTSQLGKECLDAMVEIAFMDEPQEKDFSGTAFAFFDGRRSFLRKIKNTIEMIESIIKENNYVGNETRE